MRKNLKKALTLLIAVIMVVTSVIPVFADVELPAAEETAVIEEVAEETATEEKVSEEVAAAAE